jgi:hypothetical protein
MSDVCHDSALLRSPIDRSGAQTVQTAKPQTTTRSLLRRRRSPLPPYIPPKPNAAPTTHLGAAAARAAPTAAGPPTLRLRRAPRLQHTERHAADGAVEDTAQHHIMAAREPAAAAARRRNPARAQAEPGPPSVRASLFAAQQHTRAAQSHRKHKRSQS